MTRNMFCGALLTVVGLAAQASTGSASVTCGSAGQGVYNNGQAAVMNVSYTPGSDTGTPGLFWFGVLSPDQTNGAVLTDQGWVVYQGGLYPFQARYDAGLPRTITLKIPFPQNALTTSGYVGYGLYVGHGAYTAQARSKVADRRTSLNSVKAARVAAGKWNSDYDSDDRFIWSLIQKDMMDSQKYGSLITVPFVDCTLPSHSSYGG